MKKGYWSYLNQKAATWVSVAVLAGGLVSALLLLFLVRIDSSLQNLSLQVENIEEAIQESKSN